VPNERFRNDDGGAPAYASIVLLIVILFAYSRGIVRSREIAQACQDKKMLDRHRAADDTPVEPALSEKEQERIERLQKDAAQLRECLKDNPEDRKGAKGTIRKSNRTDNESAKMATSKGVIQGYTGVAAVDAQCQVIVEAQAHGTGSEQALLIRVVDAMSDLIEKDSILTADAGYSSGRFA
jgi:hypothetical protein